MQLLVSLSSTSEVKVFPSYLMADFHAYDTPTITSLGGRIGSPAGLLLPSSAGLIGAREWPVRTVSGCWFWHGSGTRDRYGPGR